MQEVQALCDRVVIISDGLLVANESIEKLSNRMSANQIIHVEFAQKNVSPVLLHILKVLQMSSVTTDSLLSHQIATVIFASLFLMRR